MFDHDQLIKVRREVVRYAAKRLYGQSLELSADDLANEAIVIAIQNLMGLPTSRRWNRKKCNLTQFCCGLVKSKISNIRTSAPRRLNVPIENYLDNLPSDSEVAEMDYFYYDGLLSILRVQCSKDPVALAIISKIDRGGWSTLQAFAEETALTLSAAQAAWKRLRRRADRIKEMSDAA
jgi:hypothetical protein